MSYVHAGRLSNKLKETPEDQKLQLLNKKTEVNTLEGEVRGQVRGQYPPTHWAENEECVLEWPDLALPPLVVCILVTHHEQLLCRPCIRRVSTIAAATSGDTH